jgi:hypothetical protein
VLILGGLYAYVKQSRVRKVSYCSVAAVPCA